jgi:hypothetical protein
MDSNGPVNPTEDPITARLKAIKSQQQNGQSPTGVDANNPFSGNIDLKKKSRLQRLLSSLNNLFNPHRAIKA